MSAPTIMIMAGGTGGHVYPALALARAMRARSWQVVWLGTRRGIEARLVPAENFPIAWLSVGGLRGKGVLTLLAAPWKLARALFEARAAIRQYQPTVVVGLGGFASGPGGIAAWLARRPLLIHEQNAVAGLTNRWLARLAERVLTAFPGSFRAGAAASVIGNPVRADIVALPPPVERFGRRSGPLRILVIGGSQGAVKLNRIVPQGIAQLGKSVKLDIWHQSGERWIEQARRFYADAGVNARVEPYIEDMAEAYAWADLVICRSGALTVSELAAAGLGAVLVPFAAAVDDHQTRNAEYLVADGAAVMIAESELDAPRLARALQPLCEGRGRLIVMAERARLLARPRATEELADACVAVGRMAVRGLAA
jgi:UDP-N-acetylglucosamine--N-acetylmuramyl-(pentapeptide) pyrophosphoryl-undecaprenol N-acetylglucosamine transferase